MPIVDRRDPKKIYHRLERDGLAKKAPHFAWTAYFAELGYPDAAHINVAVPEFFVGLDAELQATPLADWKTYLRWHVLHGAAPELQKAFVDEDFRFYGQTMQGTAQIEPRWKRCVHLTDHWLGEALGRTYVAKHFGASAKGTTQDLVKTIETAMEHNLTGLKWMDDPTRKAALEKLSAIANKI